MALQSARQLLDELMGRERDLRPSEKHADDCEWSDDRICRFFLVKFCPNQLFTNTKADMGPCHKVHDDFVKKIYQERAKRKEKSLLEDEFIRFCQQTLADVERRIKRARLRLANSQAERNADGQEVQQTSYLSEELQAKIVAIGERIDLLLTQIEQLGCDGKVDEAQQIMKEVERLKEEKIAIKRDNMPMHWIQQRAEIGAAQEKQMEVCDVCGAFLIVNDVQQRVDDHLMGKQHVGYGKLKSALDELLAKRRQNAATDDADVGEKRDEISAGGGGSSSSSTNAAATNARRASGRSRSRSHERAGRNGVESAGSSSSGGARHRQRRERSRERGHRSGERRSSNNNNNNSSNHNNCNNSHNHNRNSNLKSSGDRRSSTRKRSKSPSSRSRRE